MKRQSIFLVLAVACAALILGGCGEETETEDVTPTEPVQMEDVQEEAVEATEEIEETAEAAKELAMQKRDEYVAKMKAELDKINAQISEFEAKLTEERVEAESDLSKSLENLKKQRDTYAAKLDDVQSAGAEAWEELKQGVQKAADDLNASFKEVRDTLTGSKNPAS